jgi:amino acid adenylation domain-containing protein
MNATSVGFRLSPLQKHVWTNSWLRAASAYLQVSAKGLLNVDRLRTCIEQLVQRHEVLRTVFQLSPGFTTPFQVVLDRPEFFWRFVDASDANSHSQADALQALLKPDAWPTVAPGEAPILGVIVVKTAPATHVITLKTCGLCCDVASLEICVVEISRLYNHQSAGDEPVQYADFSEWHNEALLTTSDESAAARDFWSTPRSLTPLPLRRQRNAPPQAAYGVFPFTIDLLHWPDSANERSTFLLGCWQALLYRLCAQESVSVSVVCAGRPLEELRHSVGLFSRPLPVATSFEGDLSFQTVFNRVGEALARVQQWEVYGPHDCGDTIGFEFTQLPAETVIDGLSLELTRCQSLPWPFQLMLACQSTNSQPTYELRYNDAEYDREDMARLARYFERAVRAAASNPAASVVEFDLLDSAESRQILIQCNGRHCDYTDTRTFHELFEAQTLLTPERPALAFEKSTLSYQQLNARANQIAHLLRSQGVGRNIPVGLCLERSSEMVIALLGILKAGGAYVPLLPDMPFARISHQIAESRLTLIITMQALLSRLPDFNGQLICLDRDDTRLQSESTANPAHHVIPDDLIYILYTSGSTGMPKGVMVRHGNVTNYIHGMTQQLGLRELSDEPGLTFATVSTLGADLGNTAIFPPLVTGGCLAVISYESALDGAQFAQRHRERPIDVLKITPSNLIALMGAAAPQQILPRQVVIVGGELCNWDLAQRVNDAGMCRMLNHYGPTEATIGCLTYAVGSGDDPAQSAASVVPLGRPLPNIQVYVLDAMRRLVPNGVPGEICVAGSGISAGYLERATETAQRFVEHPFLRPGSAMYCTGDLGRLLPDGNIEFLGRIDDQVKIRGHRVELAEIEAVLRSYPGVRQAVVLLLEGSNGQYLRAYLVSASPHGADQIQLHLRHHLPDFMIPREIVDVEQFPLNSNGKVDRRRLAELSVADTSASDEFLEPRNELEARLLVIWKETLRRDRIGIRDNFFDLGGHSLLATQIIARIRSSLRKNASIRMLFESPTIELLASSVEAMSDQESDDSESDSLLAELEGLSDAEFSGEAGHDDSVSTDSSQST